MFIPAARGRWQLGGSLPSEDVSPYRSGRRETFSRRHRRCTLSLPRPRLRRRADAEGVAADRRTPGAVRDDRPLVSGVEHAFPAENAERVTAERFLEWLGRPTASLTHAIPDWTYAWRGESWHIEITSVSLRPKEHRLAYRRRLIYEPDAIPTVPSASGLTSEGTRFETVEIQVADEPALVGLLREALLKKGPEAKRYGATDRTHLIIDASGDQVDGEAAIARVLAEVRVPHGYPYVEVVVWFALDGWARKFVRLVDADRQ